MNKKLILSKILLLLTLLVNLQYADAAQVCVSGAGTAAWNGTYDDSITPNDFILDGTHALYVDSGNFWVFNNAPGSMGVPDYTSFTTGDPSPVGLTYNLTGGAGPGPTVTAGACGAPTPTPTFTPTFTPTNTPTNTPTHPHIYSDKYPN